MRSEATTASSVAHTRRIADVALRGARERRVQAVRVAKARLGARSTTLATKLRPRIVGAIPSSIRSEVPKAY